jgi:hypothetical protein
LGCNDDDDDEDDDDDGKTKAVPKLHVLEENSTNSSGSAAIFALLSNRTILGLME